MSTQTNVTDDRFQQLKKLVREDPELQQQLKSSTDQASWADLLSRAATKKGVTITAKELTERIKQNLAQAVDAGAAIELIQVLSHHASTAATTPI